ncbi:MAG: adenylate kinase [Planctomycetes bacterium]|nr:adenylate kinase [Planctomycetota bacterium]NUQ34676.1 adenylate kinase [Planctomycetaceae bacterium]
MAKHIVLFGPPGVGKGTQAARLAQALKLPHISTGDILRENVRKLTPLGRKAKTFMDAGKLVPDELVIALVEGRLSLADCKPGFILDGFPRTTEQYLKLNEMLGRRGTPLDAVVYFTAPDSTLVERISGRRVCRTCGASFHTIFAPSKKGDHCDHCGGEIYQRSDDNETSVAERLKQYHSMSQPLIEKYRADGLLREVEGTRKPDDVFQDAVAILGGK